MTTNGFAQRLRAAREGRGMRVNELNDAAGLSAGSVTRLEFGDRVGVGALVVDKLARALNVSMDWLWRGEGPDIQDQLAASFFMASERRKLREFIEREPGRWKLRTVARALELDVPTDENGAPRGGWGMLLAAVEEGRAPDALPSPAPAPTGSKVRKRKPARTRRHPV